LGSVVELFWKCRVGLQQQLLFLLPLLHGLHDQVQSA
jgi:hypothetical protein